MTVISLRAVDCQGFLVQRLCLVEFPSARWSSASPLTALESWFLFANARETASASCICSRAFALLPRARIAYPSCTSASAAQSLSRISRAIARLSSS